MAHAGSAHAASRGTTAPRLPLGRSCARPPASEHDRCDASGYFGFNRGAMVVRMPRPRRCDIRSDDDGDHANHGMRILRLAACDDFERGDADATVNDDEVSTRDGAARGISIAPNFRSWLRGEGLWRACEAIAERGGATRSARSLPPRVGLRRRKGGGGDRNERRTARDGVPRRTRRHSGGRCPQRPRRRKQSRGPISDVPSATPANADYRQESPRPQAVLRGCGQRASIPLARRPRA